MLKRSEHFVFWFVVVEFLRFFSQLLLLVIWHSVIHAKLMSLLSSYCSVFLESSLAGLQQIFVSSYVGGHWYKRLLTWTWERISYAMTLHFWISMLLYNGLPNVMSIQFWPTFCNCGRFNSGCFFSFNFVMYQSGESSTRNYRNSATGQRGK